MSSVAYNLWRKLEYMSRRLRHIDDVGKIEQWIAAMTAINTLLKDIEIKDYKDEWRPWGHRKKKDMALEQDNDNSERARGVKKKQGRLMPPLRKPTKSTMKIGIKEEVRKPSGENDRGRKKQKLDPKAAVLEMLRKSTDQEEPKERTKSEKKRCRPPRVDQGGDEEDMLDPEAEGIKADITELDSERGERTISTEWESWRIGAHSDTEEDTWYHNKRTGVSCWERPTTVRIPRKGYKSFPR